MSLHGTKPRTRLIVFYNVKGAARVKKVANALSNTAANIAHSLEFTLIKSYL